MKKVLCYAMVAALLCGCGGQRGRHANDASRSEKGCAVYHWKTVFEMEHEEQNFLKKHDIRRIYLRMFDVAVEQDVQTGNTEIVPIATTRFESPIPVGVEVVPVTYITIGALRAMEGREQEFASLIMKRLMAMHSYNTCGELREVQLDCDWTATTRESYSTLCQVMKDSLHAKDIKLATDTGEKHADIDADASHSFRGSGGVELPAAGLGILNYELYVKRLAEEHPNIPLIIEHLDEGDIERAKRFTDSVLKRVGV